MSNYFQEINVPLPINSVIHERIISEKKQKKYRPYLFLTRNPSEFLSTESLDFFSKINIFPDTLIAFGHVDNPEYQISTPVVHSDLIYDNGTWKKVPFAINCEITDTVANLCWFDTSNVVEDFPTPENYIDNPAFHFANGVNYGSRGSRDTTNMTCIEKLTFNQGKSFLIKTDIAHAPYYEAGYNTRTHISLRFPLDKIKSYDEALEIFKPFYKQ